jgi:hypothetical protein
MSYSARLHTATGIIEDIPIEKCPEATGTSVTDYNSDYFQFGDYWCQTSPTGNCMYTNHDYDECIFCYQPSERK